MSRIFSRLKKQPLRSIVLVATATGVGTFVYASCRWNNKHAPDAPPLVPLQRDSQGRPIPPTFPQIKSRAENLAELRRHGRQPKATPTDKESNEDGDDDDDCYDLLVIGGGATGCGIALDAVTRGLRVALVERDDFAAGTSSRSTKLVHGGLRYLQQAVQEFNIAKLQLVFEALSERGTFLDIAPHLSTALPILLPLQNYWQASYLWIGAKLYDLLAAGGGFGTTTRSSASIEHSRLLSCADARAALPLLNTDHLVGAVVLYDGQHNDSRMNVALAATASLHGATVLNHVEVTGLDKDADGKICGARVRDSLSTVATAGNDKQEFHVRARGVVNATGPFADAIEQMDDARRKPIIAPSSGAHIILPARLCPNGMGMLEANTSDGRIVYVLPWQGHTLAGTTDHACEVERQPVAHDQDVDFILREVSKLLKPECTLTRRDVLATWSGIRPLVKDPNSKNTKSMVRSHLVTVSPSKLLTCVGGKWTTYRRMAEEAVDEAIKTFDLKPQIGKPLANVSGVLGRSSSSSAVTSNATTGACMTRKVFLVGSHGYSKSLASELTRSHGLDVQVAQHLAENYGDRAWTILSTTPPSSTGTGEVSSDTTVTRLLPSHPFTEAEVRYVIRAEAACTAADVIARRTRLAFLDVDGALQALPRIIDVMAQELGWDTARQTHEWRDTVRFLESMGLSRSASLRVATDDMAPVTRSEAAKAAANNLRKTTINCEPDFAVGEKKTSEQ